MTLLLHCQLATAACLGGKIELVAYVAISSQGFLPLRLLRERGLI